VLKSRTIQINKKRRKDHNRGFNGWFVRWSHASLLHAQCWVLDKASIGLKCKPKETELHRVCLALPKRQLFRLLIELQF